MFKGVAKCSITEWELSGHPTMTQRQWCQLVLNISRYNISELESIYTAAAWAMDNPDGQKAPKWFKPDV